MSSTSPDSWWSSRYCRPAARYSVCSSGFSFSMASQQIERCSADSRFSEYFNFAWFLSKLYPSGLGTCKQNHDNMRRQKHLEQQQGLRRDRHGRAWLPGSREACGDADERYVFICKGYVTFTIRQENVVFPCWMSLQILWSCESTFLRCFETGKKTSFRTVRPVHWMNQTKTSSNVDRDGLCASRKNILNTRAA